MSKPKFVFWGTPEVASKTLEILKQAGYIPALIITGEDKPVGRKMILTPSPTKLWAVLNNIPVTHNKDTDLSEFDLSIVVAYGKILSEKTIKSPKLGSFNVHYSLLPKYRGASPVESAILNGETITGVTIQKMEYKMDAGDIVAMHEVDIQRDETAPMLKDRLIKIGGKMLIDILPNILENKIHPIKQEESQATYCKKIKKEDGLINLEDNADSNYNKFRAYAERPRTFFFHKDKRVIITKAKLENNKFIIETVLPEGKKEISYQDFLKNY